MTRQFAPSTLLAPSRTEEDFGWRPDCRAFVGGLPCRYWRPCQGCNEYDPVTKRVLIVMLGLLGDMLIASPLPARIKQDDSKAHVTWLVDAACAPVLRMNPFIDRVMVFDWHAAIQLLSESFDVVLGFERTPSAAAIVDRISAKHKAGIAHGGAYNGLYALGDAASHFFKMNTWNDFRTRFNVKTWTELYFEVAGYQYNGEPYILRVPEESDRHAGDLVEGAGGVPIVCLNLGGSLSTKLWPVPHWRQLGTALLAQGAAIVLTGGPAEADQCAELHRAFAATFPSNRVRYAPLPIEGFAALPAYCDVVVTGDSFGFHLALAHKRPCVLLLGPSPGAEVVPKHALPVAPLRSTLPCAPCAHQVTCGGAGGCMDTISPEQVLAEVNRFLEVGTPGRRPPQEPA